MNWSSKLSADSDQENNSEELIVRLKRAGELLVSGDDQAEADSYFNTGDLRFHGPDLFETYQDLTNYFKSIRAALDDRSIRLAIIVAEGNCIASANPSNQRLDRSNNLRD